VFLAREAFAPAFEHLRAGCADQDAQGPGDHPNGRTRFAAVGLHWLPRPINAFVRLRPPFV
jgi:hypothetical protein